MRFSVRARLLHWLTAVLVFAGLIVGFAMANAVGSYAALLVVHVTVGITVLVVVVVRIVNRLANHPPAGPPTIGRLERWVIVVSERLMYAVLLIQPLVGWAMVSAAGQPAVAWGYPLPRIAPFNDGLYFILRQSHSVLAYLLVIVIAAHVSGVLLHTVALRDRVLSRMTFPLRPGS
jgi:cytochrome b561